MKILEITTPLGGKIELPEYELPKLERLLTNFNDKHRSKFNLVAKIIDGNIHIVPDKESHHVSPQSDTI